MTIMRYGPIGYDLGMSPMPDGEWVSYADHAAAMAGKGAEPGCCGELALEAVPAPAEPAEEAPVAVAVQAEQDQPISSAWAPELNTARDKGQMAQAAACYALSAFGYGKYMLMHELELWPWPLEFWQTTDRRQSLAIAADLIRAEIERPDHAARRAIEKSAPGDG